MVAVNGVDTFAFLAQLDEGQELTEAQRREHIEQVVGKPFEFDIICWRSPMRTAPDCIIGAGTSEASTKSARARSS